MSLVERFWSKVEVLGPDDCWLWTASTMQKGYGHIRVCGRLIRAHRLAWELAHGPIPEGMGVLHSCDVRYPVGDITSRRCVNERHLFLGSNADNSADMVAKGRSANCSNGVKLTEQDVLEIRSSLGSQGETAAIYGIHRSTVSLIQAGKRRAHVHAH